MKFYIKIFAILFPILVALDVSWIGVIANSFYKHAFGDLLTTTPNYYAAGAFYVLYACALMYFALLPALKEESFVLAFVRGAALGFVSYMTYDLTNMATLTNWPLMLTLVDITWGVVMSAVASGLTYLLSVKLYGLEHPEASDIQEQVLA